MCEIINKFLIISVFLINSTWGNFVNYIDLIKKINLKNTKLSENCLVHIVGAMKSGALIRMFDASTKIPEGLLSGRLHHLGLYDSCLNTTYTIRMLNSSKIYNAKYCLGTTPLGIRTAICFPSGCTLDDLVHFPLHLISTTYSEKSCYEKTETINFTVGSIITMAFFGCIVVIVLLSTIFDGYLQWKNKDCPYLISIFSIYSNIRKLLKTHPADTNSNQLLCLNGIKAISMIWVILGHHYAISSLKNMPLNERLELLDWYYNVGNMVIIGSTITVDTFLTISGLLSVYTFLRAQQKHQKFNLFTHYLHRYLRLTPALGVVVLFNATLIPYIGDGPLWGDVDDLLAGPCRKYWWSNLLYMQNYINEFQDMCLPQSWYLSIDTQLFLLSPIILIILKYRPFLAIFLLIVLSIIGMIIPFWLSMVDEVPALYLPIPELVYKHLNVYYCQTYTRFTPYTFGMIAGYIVYKMRIKVIRLNLNLPKIICLWMVTIIGLSACLFAGHTLIISEYHQLSHSLYLAFNRPAWSLGISLCIILCISNYGGLINQFLSLPIFQILTKLSYAMYLTHVSIIVVVYMSQRVLIRYYNFEMMTRFWSTFVLTLATSVLLYLMFELPIAELDSRLFSGFRKQGRTPKITPA